MSTMKSFAIASPNLAPNQSYSYFPLKLSVSGLKPNTIYDFYVNDKIYNQAVVQFGSARVYASNGSDVIGPKSDAAGECKFTFYPAIAYGGGLFGGGSPFILKKLELRGPDGTPVTPVVTSAANVTAVAKAPAGIPAVIATPPVIKPSNPVVASTIKPTVAAVKTTTTTTKTISDYTAETGRTDLGVLRETKTYGVSNQTPLSEVSLFFDYIQSFYIDPSSVNGSQTVSLTDVELFFKQKPDAINNQSQILNPGVYVYICQIKDGQPDLSKVYTESKVRLKYSEIFPSLDAKSSTFFTFKSPLNLKTGESYGIVVNFEDPQFSLWTATQGQLLLDTGKPCGSAYTSGKLFRASNYLEIDKSPKTLDQLFKPLSDTDLKFYVNILEFSTAAKSIQLVNQDYEFIVYNNLVANNVTLFPSFITGENIYQDFGNSSANVTFFKSGTLKVTEGTAGEIYNLDSLQYIVNGTNTKFLSELDSDSTIVITDGTLGNSNIRTIAQVISDTRFRINEPTTFTNLAARYKVTAVGTFESLFLSPNTAILNNSNASDITQFIKNGVNYIAFTAGQGYTNSDYIVFTGGIVDGKANIATNGTGNIVSINITNTGYGFTTTPVSSVYTSTGSAGNTSATITATPGAQIKGDISLAKAEIANVTVFTVDSTIPDLQVEVKGASYADPQINFALLNTVANNYTILGSNFIPIYNDSIDIKSYDAVILSKSLEIANKTSLGGATLSSKSSIIKFNITTSNKYESPELHTAMASIYTFNNLINNDATDEYTGSGNATSRHISKKITFAKNRFAEDIRLIATVWKPAGTDVKFYARVHNSKDEEAFDDKDWTELEFKDATFSGKTYSSLSDDKDYVELTYGFRAYPEISSTVTGLATLANSGVGNTTITGSGTTFNTQIANGDIIVLYDPLFANTTYAVAVVANTPVATSFEINTALANASLGAASLKIGVASNKNSAFNNIQNDNVVRYYSTSTNEFDTYDTLAIKIVPLSSKTYIIPRVNDIRVIGVSA